MAARKTVDVATLLTMVNNICRYSVDESKGVRQGAMNVLEQVLHDTGNYKGFRYLCTDEMEPGYTAGINSEYGKPLPNDYELRFNGCDNTRVQYF